MPWRNNTVMSQRLEFIYCYQAGAQISHLCSLFGISRKTGYKWLQRANSNDPDWCHDRSHRPHSIPNQTDPAIVARIITLRQQHPYWGPRKLWALLRDELPVERLPAMVTVSRILARNDLSKPSEAVTFPTVSRFERSQPNELWQMDLKGAIRLANGRKAYPIAILDDHSRFLLTLKLVMSAEASPTLQTWIDAAQRYGLPVATLTDHGSQFRTEDDVTSAFRVFLWACEVQHAQGRIRHPQTQGKVERLWRTLNKELINQSNYGDAASWQMAFEDWRQQYNEVRPHQELGDRPPVTRYRASDRKFEYPTMTDRIGEAGSQYRVVNERGYIQLSKGYFMIGRGFSGWKVEARPLGTGFWHIYFRNRFIRELWVTPKSQQKRFQALQPTAFELETLRGEEEV